MPARYQSRLDFDHVAFSAEDLNTQRKPGEYGQHDTVDRRYNTILGRYTDEHGNVIDDSASRPNSREVFAKERPARRLYEWNHDDSYADTNMGKGKKTVSTARQEDHIVLAGGSPDALRPTRRQAGRGLEATKTHVSLGMSYDSSMASRRSPQRKNNYEKVNGEKWVRDPMSDPILQVSDKFKVEARASKLISPEAENKTRSVIGDVLRTDVGLSASWGGGGGGEVRTSRRPGEYSNLRSRGGAGGPSSTHDDLLDHREHQPSAARVSVDYSATHNKRSRSTILPDDQPEASYRPLKRPIGEQHRTRYDIITGSGDSWGAAESSEFSVRGATPLSPTEALPRGRADVIASYGVGGNRPGAGDPSFIGADRQATYKPSKRVLAVHPTGEDRSISTIGAFDASNSNTHHKRIYQNDQHRTTFLDTGHVGFHEDDGELPAPRPTKNNKSGASYNIINPSMPSRDNYYNRYSSLGGRADVSLSASFDDQRSGGGGGGGGVGGGRGGGGGRAATSLGFYESGPSMRVEARRERHF